MEQSEFKQRMIDEDNRFIGELKQLCEETDGPDLVKRLHYLQEDSKRRQQELFQLYLDSTPPYAALSSS
jgi:hypothetical protein